METLLKSIFTCFIAALVPLLSIKVFVGEGGCESPAVAGLLGVTVVVCALLLIWSI